MLSVSRPVFLLLLVLSCSLGIPGGCGSSPTTTDEGKTDSTAENSQPNTPISADAPTNAMDPKPSPKPLPTYSDEAFRIAAHDGNIDLVRRAIESGTKVDAADPAAGYTALLMAAYNGHADVVKLLLDNHAEVDASDKQGKTPLMHACTGPFVETVRLLIDAGADVNATESTESFTPLMTAAALGQMEIVKLLISHSADKGAVDLDGDTAISHAGNAGHEEIVKLLK